MTRNLRAFPHVIERIKLLWGHPELEIYIRKLQMPDRNRNEGFPLPAFRDLTHILDVHRMLFAKEPAAVAFSHPTL